MVAPSMQDVQDTIRVLTWNVNSVRKRILHLCTVLEEHKVDIAMLQEIKCVNDDFPYAELEALGYTCYVHGQKSRNGVAILSKFPVIGEVSTTVFDVEEMDFLPSTGGYSTEEARYIECLVDCVGTQVRAVSVYVPNGQEVNTATFDYKLNFLRRLKGKLKHLLVTEDVLIAGGDYNVAPDAIDVYDPRLLEGKLCFHPEERARFHEILHSGLMDAFRVFHEDKQEFSWWNYREGAWQQNRGMRIDHLLLSPQATDRLLDCSILSKVRDFESPSDHAPVICSLKNYM
ncbi:MAG: exodeoxyribonuclease III [Anaplasma sp.]